MATTSARSAPCGDFDPLESPALNVDDALALAERLYGLVGGTASELVGYDDKNFLMLPDEVAGNDHLATLAPSGYTLKVTNSLDSRDEGFMEGQTQLLAFLADRGMTCPRPVKTKSGKTYSMEQLRPDGPAHVVRLLEFVPGDILGRVPWEPQLARQAGREVATLNILLDEAHVPAVEARVTEWSLSAAPDVLQLAHVVPDAARRALVSEVLQAFRRATDEHGDFLRADRGLVHGDFNQFNIVVRRPRAGAPYAVAGVLDLGDSHAAPRLFEVAMAAMYMAMTSGGMAAIADVLAGYSERRPLCAEAIDLLRVCMCARLCQSLVKGLQAYALNPTNTYVLDSQENGWPLLQTLWQAPPGAFEQQWRRALGMP